MKEINYSIKIKDEFTSELEKLEKALTDFQNVIDLINSDKNMKINVEINLKINVPDLK